LKDVVEGNMKRLVSMTVIKMCGEAILITILVGIVIAIIGNLNGWETSVKYSNAFFIAGCLVIIAGASSRMGAGQDWGSFQMLSGENFRDMSPGERANFIVEASSSFRLVILGLLSGVLLILISQLVWYWFA
jgi:hypothetical protein